MKRIANWTEESKVNKIKKIRTSNDEDIIFAVALVIA